MKRRYFAHGNVRTLIAAFGAMFNKTYVATFSDDGTAIDKLVHVPLMYLPRSRIFKFENTITNNLSKTDLDRYNRFYEVYPRMGFEWKGMDYDASRQLPQSLNKRVGKQAGKVPAPYNHQFELTILTRDQSTMFQILEQITAYFRPNVTLTIQHTAFDGASEDINININNVVVDDETSEYDHARVVMAKLTFTAQTSFWPYVLNADIEIGKFVECGGKVDYPIDPLWPKDPSDDNGEIDLIEKIIIDTHEMAVFDNIWPTIDRTTSFYDAQGKFQTIVDENPPSQIPEDYAAT
jgi:hypothetical protein